MIELEQGEFYPVARGRNGNFVPKAIDITRHFEEVGGVGVNIWSARQGKRPPIMLRVSKDDALKIAAGLLGWPEEVLKRLGYSDPGQQAVALAIWSEEDVKDRAEEREITLHEGDAARIVRMLDDKQDASVGISWDTIDFYLDGLCNEADPQLPESIADDGSIAV